MSTSIQPRHWLPAVWGHTDFSAGQTTALVMAINGWPSGITEFSLAQRLSLVGIGIELDASVTAGFLRFQLSLNGSPVGSTFDMDTGTGKRRLIELAPGAVVGQKSDRVGLLWGSSPSLAPAGSIDGVIALAVEAV